MRFVRGNLARLAFRLVMPGAGAGAGSLCRCASIQQGNDWLNGEKKMRKYSNETAASDIK